MSLDPRRKNYVTASQCHRVMAGFEKELAGRSMEKPDISCFNDLADIINQTGKKPLVGECKNAGVACTGKDIAAVYDYIKATTPVFSDGMFSVALEIAMYSFIETKDEGITTPDMERGNENELEAIFKLSEYIETEFINTGDDQAFFTRDSLGVTPDGVEYGDSFDIVSCAEVKCPKDTTHMRYLYQLRNQKDLLKYKPEYYWQAQCGLYVTGADIYHWASYHDGFMSGYQLVYIPVYPVREHIEILAERAEKVLTKVPAIIEHVKENIKNEPM